MKKTILLAIATMALVLFVGRTALAESHDDIQAIKKAVKENPAYQPGAEVKWLKVLVTDTSTGKENVKITLPISLVDILVNCAGEKNLTISDKGTNIDVRMLLAELKKVGPMAFIEINEDDETVKVWME